MSRSRIDIRLDTEWHDVDAQVPERSRRAHSDRLRINCAVPKAANKGTENIFLTWYFHRHPGVSWDTTQWSAASNPSQSTSINTPSNPYSGRKRPLVADLSLFKQWKIMCQQVHGAKCSEIFKGTPKIAPRVIDVNQRCLVQAQTTDTWVCLSYVWGTAITTRLSKSNEQAFLSPGALGQTVLPPIAEDALQVTKEIGERYLWIDSMCIVQDDSADKARFVSQMDSIYALASVVIVAATCVDANSRLPGIQTGTRHQDQQVFVVRGVSLVQSLDPVQGVNVDYRTGRAGAYLGTTIWDTRAWTLQERFLAPRVLVFTPEQVFWECEEAFWCEDSYRELPQIAPDNHRTSLCRGELNLSWNSDRLTFDHFYRILLGEYSTRAMKYESDTLNAFLGIIRAFERSMNLQFFWGMPTSFLESALAWGNRTHALRRRLGAAVPKGHLQPLTQFPSWSWTGWMGDDLTKIDNQNLTMEPLGLDFYRVSDDGHTMQRLPQELTFNATVDLLRSGSLIEHHTSRVTSVTIMDLPRSTPPSILPGLLCFWTASTYVEIARSSTGQHNTPRNPGDQMDWTITMSQGGDNPIEVSWFHIPQVNPSGLNDKVEIIAIAQNRGNWDGGHVDNGAIGVMLIDWKDGIAYRRGFAWIAIRDWTALNNRTWKLICLG